MTAVRAFLRQNSLGLFFLALFLAVLGAQSFVGWLDFNEEARAHDSAEYSYGRYLLSSQFGQAVLENWQSEYLQFLVFVAATIWLVQRGSPESKTLEDAGPESDRTQLVGRYAGRVDRGAGIQQDDVARRTRPVVEHRLHHAQAVVGA